MAVSIGDINFGVTANLQQLNQAIQAIERLGQITERAARAQGAGAQAATAAFMRQEQATSAAIQKARDLQTAMQQAGMPAAAINTVTTELNRLTQWLTRAQASTLEFNRATMAFNAGIATGTTQLRSYVAAQRDSERVARDSAAAQKQFARESDEVARRLATAENQVRRFNAAAATRRARSGQEPVSEQTARVAGAFQNLQSVLGDPAASTKDATQAQIAFRKALTESQIVLRNYSSAAQLAGGHTSTFGAALHRLGQVTVLTTGPLGGFSTRIQVLARFFSSMPALLAAAVGGVGLAIAAFVKLSEAIVHVERSLDTEGRVLTAINGNHTVTEVQMRRLMQTADQTGTKFEELIGPFTKWIQTTKNTGLEGERANTIFQQMAAVAGAMHMPIEKFAGSMDNMRRMVATNTVTLRELHQRLETELPGSSHIAAKALGVTVDQLESLQKVGMSSQEFLVKFMKAYSDSVGGVGNKVEGLTAVEARWHNSQTKLLDALDKTFHISNRYMGMLTILTNYFNLLAQSVNITSTAFGDLAKIMFGPALEGLARVLDKMSGVYKTLGNAKPNSWDPVGNFFREASERVSQRAADIRDFAKVSEEGQLAAQGFGSAIAGALPPFEEFIKAQKESKFQTDVSTTDDYINKIEEEIEKRKQLVDELKQQVQATKDTVYHGFGPNIETQNKNYERLTGKVAQYTMEIDKLKKQESELLDIRTKPQGPEKFDPIAQPDWAKKMREYTDELYKYNEESKHMGEGSENFERWKKDVEALNTELARWREKLTDTATGKTIPGMTEKLDGLAKAFQKSKEYAQQLKEIMTPGQFALNVFDHMASSVGTFSDALVEGTLNMKKMGDIAKQILKQMIADFIKLALLAPLKNSLFNTHDQTFGMSSGGGPGVGGIVGSLISSMGFGGGPNLPTMAQGGMGPDMAARGMAITPGGFRFAGGGIFGTPTMFGTGRGPILGGESGPEGILPLTRGRGGVLGVMAKFPNAGQERFPTAPPTNIHFHGAPPGTQVHESTDANGGKRLDAFFSDMMAKSATTPGSSFQQGMKGTFGLSPSTIKRGVA
jgi:hypothetical protein